MAQRKNGRSSRSKKEPSLSEYWLGQHRSWLKSGQTQADFCEEHELSLPSFRWWRWKLKKGGQHAEPSTAPLESGGQGLRWVPVRLVDPEVPRPVSPPASPSIDPSSAFEVTLESGTHVRVPMDFDAEALSRLLRTLGAARC